MSRLTRWVPVLSLFAAACAPAPRPPLGTTFVLPPVPEVARAGTPIAATPTPTNPFLPPASTPEPTPSGFPSILPTAAPATPTPVPGGVSTLAGAEEPGYLDGLGRAARFESPSGLVIDAAGNAYVADTQNHRIRKVAPDGTVTTLAGSNPGYVDGPGEVAEFDAPVGLALGPEGVLYVADSANARIRMVRWDAEGAVTVSTLAGNDERDAVDGAGLAASFNVPFGLAADAAGRLYVTDRLAQVIRRIDDPTGVATVTTIAGENSTLGDTDGAGTAAHFAFPTGIAVDSARGVIYIAEEDGCRLRRIGPDGVTTTLNASAGGCGYTDGPLPDAQFLGPAGLAVAPDGKLYLADTDNGAIRVLDPAAGSTDTLTGGSPGASDGPLDTAEFLAPRALAFGADGRLVVTDANSVRTVGF